MRTPINQSEVARLRAQIEREYAAACAGLHGLSAGSARHDFIQRRMANAQEYGEQLIEQIGKEAALPLIVEAMEAGSQQSHNEQGKGETRHIPLWTGAKHVHG
jgi:hypothetical protein